MSFEFDEKKLVVAGIPRSGTTYVYRCIENLGPGGGTPKGEAYKRLSTLKVHSLAPPDSFDDPQAAHVIDHVMKRRKVIFVFGDPVLSVLSTFQKRWDHVHAANCGFYGDLGSANIFMEDIFNYEAMFDTWMNCGWNVCCVRYEAIPRVKGYINHFVNTPVEWTPWKERGTTTDNVPPGILNIIKSTYRNLIYKIDNAPDLIINKMGTGNKRIIIEKEGS